jgi:hypothetical protein
MASNRCSHPFRRDFPQGFLGKGYENETDRFHQKKDINIGRSFIHGRAYHDCRCGGGGGDNDNGPGDDAGGNAVISATTVNDALAWFEGTVPGCQRTGVAGVTSAAASNINNVSVLSEVYSLLKDAKSVSGRRQVVAPAAAQTFSRRLRRHHGSGQRASLRRTPPIPSHSTTSVRPTRQ